MGFKIGSFNMYKWNKGNTKKDLDLIATIIKKEQFDIIAMQEVLSKEAVKELVSNYLPQWEYRWDTPVSYSNNAAEGYAFIWNTKRIGLTEYEQNGLTRVFEPRILNQYKLDKKDGQSKLIRNPYYGRFTPNKKVGGCFIEFRLINTHINYGKKDDGSDALGAISQRNKEYDILTEAIYPKYADKRYGTYMPAYTIILGDYNLCLKESGCGSYIDKETIDFFDGGKHKSIETKQAELTTISTAQDERVIYANNYDHFTFDTVEFKRIDSEPKIGRVDAVIKYLNSSKSEYKVSVSDHVPIYMDLDFRRGRK